MIKRVWIEEGCISCSLCSDLVPEVFVVENGDSCIVRDDAAAWFAGRFDDIREAADDCPVEVIKIEQGPAEGSA